MKKQTIARSDISKKSKNLKIAMPKIHAKNEEDPVKNKKIARRNVLAKLGERKNAQVQTTLMTRSCTLCTLKDSQNSLVSKSEKFLELALKLKKLWPK
jgi:hypothetical protein